MTTYSANTPVHRTPRWLLTGCLIVAVLVLAFMCWLATLGYMTTLRMAGL
jgi:hypothetical protein